MDYEKKYKEALERTKELQHDNCWITSIFPELKESEDGENKRISKEITQFLKQNNGWNREWLVWLEKQGEKDKLIQELGEYKVKYIQETLEKALTMNNKDNERLRKTTIAFLKEFADKGYENAIECIDWLEKQVPIDKEKVLIGARKDIALSIISFLDRNTLGMFLSNMESADLESAVVDSDWSKVYDYMKKKLEKQNEQKSKENKL